MFWVNYNTCYRQHFGFTDFLFPIKPICKHNHIPILTFFHSDALGQAVQCLIILAFDFWYLCFIEGPQEKAHLCFIVYSYSFDGAVWESSPEKNPVDCLCAFYPQPKVHCFPINAGFYDTNYSVSLKASFRLLFTIDVTELCQQ